MTAKPTIFFSHSSKDEVSLRELKNILSDKTGNTVDIFLSSDGQSIQLGRNWVHKVEDALENAKIMFVFLSPNSLQSKWVYFESGFSYAKNISVIPIGILGVDLDSLSPPLSLLHGFNIRNYDGLNNIISIINEEFYFSFKESFTEEDFSKIFSAEELSKTHGLGPFTLLIDRVDFTIPIKDDSDFEKIGICLDKAKIEYQKLEEGFHSYGISFKQIDNKLKIAIDPSLTDLTFPIAEQVLYELKAITEGVFSFNIVFFDAVTEIDQYHRITSRIYNTEITLVSNGLFRYKNVEFNIAHYFSYEHMNYKRGQTYLHVNYKDQHLINGTIIELLNILFSQEILVVNEETLNHF